MMTWVEVLWYFGDFIFKSFFQRLVDGEPVDGYWGIFFGEPYKPETGHVVFFCLIIQAFDWEIVSVE